MPNHLCDGCVGKVGNEALLHPGSTIWACLLVHWFLQLRDPVCRFSSNRIVNNISLSYEDSLRLYKEMFGTFEDFRLKLPDSVRLLLDDELHKTRPHRRLSVEQRRVKTVSGKL